MCFRTFFCGAIGLLIFASCSQYRKIELVRSGEVRMSLSVTEDEREDEEFIQNEVEDGIGNVLSSEPFLMNAVIDEESGEMVAVDVLNASSVTARFRNVAERAGYITIGFDINVPAAMADSKFRLKLYPKLKMFEDITDLEPVVITGAKYREGQLRGYERYRRFVASIVTDTTDFVRIGQLEIFLQRHFPETYKMKNDTSLISDPQAETLFGATQEEALRHYVRKIKRNINQRRISRMEDVFRKYVKDPIVKEGIRLDTVFTGENGDFVYRYLHTFKAAALLKKVTVSMNGQLFADGLVVAQLPDTDELTFYISTLSTLIDDAPRYRMIVVERQIYDSTKVFLDFKVGSASVDTALGKNAAELLRVKECIADVVEQNQYVLDSLLVVASCSPEGSWNYNSTLSARRADAVLGYIKNSVPEDLRSGLKSARIPENWGLLKVMIEQDSVIVDSEKAQILELIELMEDPDRKERMLSRHKRYGYIKEKLYPQLRCVSFDFYLHRVGMVKDTIHTTELDSLYMSGIEALKNLDYKTAVSLLAPYQDYNSALAYVSADRNHSALEVLNRMDNSDPKVCYLMAVVLARLELNEKALMYYKKALAGDPALRHRANLDPELSNILELNN